MLGWEVLIQILVFEQMLERRLEDHIVVVDRVFRTTRVMSPWSYAQGLDGDHGSSSNENCENDLCANSPEHQLLEEHHPAEWSAQGIPEAHVNHEPATQELPTQQPGTSCRCDRGLVN